MVVEVPSKRKHVKLPNRGFSELLFGVGQKKYLQEISKDPGERKKTRQESKGHHLGSACFMGSL